MHSNESFSAIRAKIALQRPKISQQKLGREVLQTSRGSFSKSLLHHQRKIECAHLQQNTLQKVLSSAEIYAPHPSRLIRMREAAFERLPSPPQQFFASLPVDAPPIAVHRLLSFGFAFPMSRSAIRFRDIAPHPRRRSPS
jgi:hypothetical protein